MMTTKSALFAHRSNLQCCVCVAARMICFVVMILLLMLPSRSLLSAMAAEYNPSTNSEPEMNGQVMRSVAASAFPATPFLNLTGTEAVAAKHKQPASACFVKSIVRGAGVPLNSCPVGNYEKKGLLCYHSCRSGYYGVGPVCWQSCPSDLTDIGLFCKNTSYGKGCCCTIFGCCNKCPPGYRDIGCFCTNSFAKGSYGRGAGVPMVCGPHQEQNGALCYDRCPIGYVGEGPVCWGSSAIAAFHVKCNEIVWAKDEATCTVVRTQIVTGGVTSAPCIAAVVVATITMVGWPVAATICIAALPDAIKTVNNLIELTGATTCPSR